MEESTPQKPVPPALAGQNLYTHIRRYFWPFTTYFGEGFPYSIVRLVSSVYLKENGASLQAIGLTSLYGLAWTLKFLWSPFVDAFSTKRRWLVTLEFLLTASMLALAFGSLSTSALGLVAVLFLLTGILSATHDISVDGFYLEHLDKKEQASLVGVQAMSYRLALITGGGQIVYLSSLTGWWTAFLACSAIMALLAFIHLIYLPRRETPRQPIHQLLRYLVRLRVLLVLALAAAAIAGGHRLWEATAPSPVHQLLKRMGWPGVIASSLSLVLIILALLLPLLKRKLYASNSFYALAFVDYLNQPAIGWSLAFIICYRSGESFLLNMAYPFLNDIGITKAQYGIAYGTFGVIAGISGGLLGGFLISRFGLRKMIWPVLLAQMIPNLFYLLLAWYNHAVAIRRASLAIGLGADAVLSPLTMLRSLPEMMNQPGGWTAGLIPVTTVIILDSLGSGMGNAGLMVYIMRTCKKQYKAANMATATSIMTVSATLAGVFSGFLAAWLGYATFFGITVLACLPAMGCAFFLPYLGDASATDLPPAPGNSASSSPVSGPAAGSGSAG